MRITLVTPAAKRTRVGNRVTALRVAALLRGLGHRTRVICEWEADGADALFALHARKSALALQHSRREAPHQMRVLILTGTDVYGDLETSPEARKSLELADRIVVLQAHARTLLPRTVQAKTRVIQQSAKAPPGPRNLRHDRFDVCVLAHLRPVKEPLLTARAARRLPAHSKVHVRLVGSALTPESLAEVREELERNTRLEWLGNLPHGQTLRLLADSRVLVLTSHNEGGPAVVTEAIACGVPVLSTRIGAAIALLGDDHPGLFDVGDEQALAKLLARCEDEPEFLAELQLRSESLRPSVSPERESRAWSELLSELIDTAPIPSSTPRESSE